MYSRRKAVLSCLSDDAHKFTINILIETMDGSCHASLQGPRTGLNYLIKFKIKASSSVFNNSLGKFSQAFQAKARAKKA